MDNELNILRQTIAQQRLQAGVAQRTAVQANTTAQEALTIGEDTAADVAVIEGFLGSAGGYDINNINTTLRVTGASNLVSGAGGEFFYSGNVTFVVSYDRTGAAWRSLSLNGLTVRLGAAGTDIVQVTTAGFEPFIDNTYYLGRNDDDSPKAWKGLVLKDQVNGKYYRIEIQNGALVAVDLTD